GLEPPAGPVGARLEGGGGGQDVTAGGDAAVLDARAAVFLEGRGAEGQGGFSDREIGAQGGGADLKVQRLVGGAGLGAADRDIAVAGLIEAGSDEAGG